SSFIGASTETRRLSGARTMTNVRRAALSVGSVLFLVLAAAVIGRLLSPEEATPPGARPSTPSGPASPPSAPATRATQAGEVDLLALVRLDENVVSGTWKKTNEGALLSPAEPEARVQIPYAPPEEYDLRVVALRKSSDFRSFHIGLVAGGRQFLVTLDGFG